MTAASRNHGGRILIAATAGVLSVLGVRVFSRRAQPAPGLGRVGKNDGYTYRYATRGPGREVS